MKNTCKHQQLHMIGFEYRGTDKTGVITYAVSRRYRDLDDEDKRRVDLLVKYFFKECPSDCKEDVLDMYLERQSNCPFFHLGLNEASEKTPEKVMRCSEHYGNIVRRK